MSYVFQTVHKSVKNAAEVKKKKQAEASARHKLIPEVIPKQLQPYKRDSKEHKNLTDFLSTQSRMDIFH